MLLESLSLPRELLIKKATRGETLTYREFATALDIITPPIIKTCTDILEQLIEKDKVLNQPILAALVVQQGSPAIPRIGFYQALIRLGLYHGETTGNEAQRWHDAELEKLIKFYRPYQTHET